MNALHNKSTQRKIVLAALLATALIEMVFLSRFWPQTCWRKLS